MFHRLHESRLTFWWVCLSMVIGLSVHTTPAHADDWGCQVALCMSNPAGPLAVSECHPPIDRLFDQLRHGGGFPSCDGSGVTLSMSNSPYPLCPTGTQALGVNETAFDKSGQMFVGVGDGSGMSTNFWMAQSLPPLVCVAGPLGNVTYQVPNGQNMGYVYGFYRTITGMSYQTVKTLPPFRGNGIAVQMNGQLINRVGM